MSGIAELFGAIRRGDAATVGDRLAARPGLANARDEHGNSALLVATYSGQHDIVRLLLERGARASFFEACALGLAGDVRRQLGENPGAVGQWAHDGWPPLHLAAFFGQRETAELLLDAGADVRAVARNSEANLAINAAAAGPRADRRPEMVGLLIERGSPVDGRGTLSGLTPLHEAAFNGDLALARLLLDRGADRSVRTAEGERPLDIAVKHGRSEVARLLGG
ncbi:MAG: ankyrin repeat domain-containing protein [Candidatus Rokuibacteriota bacterium]